MEQPVAGHECLACGHTDYRMSKKPVDDLVPNSCPKCHSDMVIKSRGKLPNDLESVVNLIDKHFFISDFFISSEQKEFLVESETRKKSFSKLLSDLKKEGYIAKMNEANGETKLTVREGPKIEKSNITINILLFLATIVTTFGVAGYWFLYDGNVLKAALFSSSLLTILGAHELGHKVSTWRNDVEASWPYFLPIPYPPFIGTLGAVIKNKGPIPTKEALTELGASGPLTGFVLAVPITIIGLILSTPTGGEEFLFGSAAFEVLPTPLIYVLIGKVTFGHFPLTLHPHPLAWAGFIGLLVTWLNLLPTGQLDGGHVARSLMSENQHFILTRTIGLSLLILSLFWPGFLLLAFFILFIVGGPHPGALDNVSDLEKKHKDIALITFMVFILCIPIPMWVI